MMEQEPRETPSLMRRVTILVLAVGSVVVMGKTVMDVMEFLMHSSTKYYFSLSSCWLPLFWDLFLILLFVLQHTLINRAPVSTYISRIFSSWDALLPAHSALWTALFLQILMTYWSPVSVSLFYWHSPFFTYIFYFGWGLLFLQLLAMDPLQLLGLKQAWNAFRGFPYDHEKTVGAARLSSHSRHPLFVAPVLILLGSLAGTTPSWPYDRVLLASVILLYLIFGHSIDAKDRKYVKHRVSCFAKYQ